MRSKNTITVELNQVDAAIAAVLLAERAGTAAFMRCSQTRPQKSAGPPTEGTARSRTRTSESETL